MLWSDPDDEPPEELRATQAMLARLFRVLAVAVLAALVLSRAR
ncbi:morphogenic membrane protein MmpB [Streptomyces gossypii]|nr:hypothetical protein [Streptomyces gossypii]